MTAASLANSRLAAAHPEFTPAKVNRYLKVSLPGGGRVRLAYTVMVGAGPAERERRAADVNHDGVLDDAETRAYAEALGARVRAGLTVEIDGAPPPLRWEPALPGFDDRGVGASAFSVDLIGYAEAPGRGPHLVRLDDRTEQEDLGNSEVRIEEGPGTRVLAAWHGREDAGRVLLHVWNGPRYSVLEDRTVGFRYIDEKAASPWPRRLLAIGGALLVALLGAAGLAFRRRRR